MNTRLQGFLSELSKISVGLMFLDGTLGAQAAHDPANETKASNADRTFAGRAAAAQRRSPHRTDCGALPAGCG